MQYTVLHFGSYWMGSNDIVNLMQGLLARLPDMKVVGFDVQLYQPTPSPFVVQDGRVNWIKDETVTELLVRHQPHILICNAGGLSFTPAMHSALAKQGIYRVGIALSDPDDFLQRSRHFAKYFDLFYTNATESVASYADIGVKVKVLPFAADATFHRPLNIPKTYDVVVVGGMRPERARLVSRLRENGLRVGCFGNGWTTSEAKRRNARPVSVPEFARKSLRWLRNRYAICRFLPTPSRSTEVHGQDHVVAINSGTVYLSFAQTVAGFTNVKVGLFEAAACGACVLVHDFAELHRYFQPGKEIVTYDTESDAISKARQLCRNTALASQFGVEARKRILAEHTWEHRWREVLADIHQHRCHKARKGHS